MIYTPYVYFWTSLIFVAVYAIHIKHVNQIGFDAYIRELEKSHDMNYYEASKNARFTLNLSWVIVIAGSVEVIYFGYESITYFLNHMA